MFVGIEPAGLFWSAHAVGDIHRRLRLRITDVTTPLQTTIYVLDGHVDVTTPPDSDSGHARDGDGAVMLCSCTLDRLYMANHVIREPVRVGKLRGTLFIPNSEFSIYKTVMYIDQPTTFVIWKRYSYNVTLKRDRAQ